MNKTKLIKLLNSGKGIITQIKNIAEVDDLDETIDLGIHRYKTAGANQLVYFMKSPANNEYIMFVLEPEDNKIVHLLFHHKDINEMIDFDEIDFSLDNTFDIADMKGITHYVDFHTEELELKRIKIIQ